MGLTSHKYSIAETLIKTENAIADLECARHNYYGDQDPTSDVVHRLVTDQYLEDRIREIDADLLELGYGFVVRLLSDAPDEIYRFQKLAEPQKSHSKAWMLSYRIAQYAAMRIELIMEEGKT